MLIKNMSEDIIVVKGVKVLPGRELFITPKDYNKIPARIKILFRVTMTDCPFEELEQVTIGERIEEDKS